MLDNAVIFEYLATFLALLEAAVDFTGMSKVEDKYYMLEAAVFLPCLSVLKI